jgi:hypothetical protein
MKKSIFLLIVLGVIFALISVSCTTTPKQEPVPPPPPPPEAPTTSGLDEAKAKAEDARKRAMDFESPAYFPSDWEAAEAQYTAAGNMPKSTAGEIQQATASYNRAADAYDELFRKTVPLYAQAREDEIMAAREELIATGFTNSFPDYLQNADKIALEANEQYEAGKYYEAKDTAAKALNEYQTLMIGARIFLARQEIVDRGFWKYDSNNFDKADEVTINAMNEYEAGNREAAVTNAEEALLRYNLVLSNGWTAYSADRRNSAALERELALSERANIAARDSFREADVIYNQAEGAFSSGNFQNAAVLYTDAEALFAIARHETEEKRLRAIETIRLAEEKIDESNETAIEAERIIEGGSR